MPKVWPEYDADTLASEVLLAQLQGEKLARKNGIQAPFCLYCGFPASQRDHVIPIARQPGIRRRFLRGEGPQVDACQPCNIRLQAHIFPTFEKRLRWLHERYRLKYLQRDSWDEDEAARLGPNLSQMMRAYMLETQQLLARVWWGKKMLAVLRDPN